MWLTLILYIPRFIYDLCCGRGLNFHHGVDGWVGYCSSYRRGVGDVVKVHKYGILGVNEDRVDCECS